MEFETNIYLYREVISDIALKIIKQLITDSDGFFIKQAVFSRAVFESKDYPLSIEESLSIQKFISSILYDLSSKNLIVRTVINGTYYISIKITDGVI